MFNKKAKLFQNSSSFVIDSSLLKASVTFLSNIVRTKIFNIDAKRGPLFISWLCTYRCNANCRFCNTHEMNKRYPEGLSLKRALEIAHEIGRAKTWVVGFTGGEVLLWPYLFDVIKVLKQYGVKVYFITNGLLLKKNAEKIIEAGVDTVVVSLDDLSAAEHDDNRRVPGIYNLAIEGIKFLKTNRKGQKPIIKSTTVLSKKTYPKIEQIISHLAELVDVTAVQPVVTGYANGPHDISQTEKSSFLPEPGKKRLVEEAILRLTRRYPAFNNFYFKNISTYWFNPEKLLKINCWSPFLRLLIMPDGSVSHCPVNPKYSTVGNLKSLSLMEAWNSQAIKRQREEIRRHNNNCVCWSQDTSFNAFLHGLPLINKLPIFKNKKFNNSNL
ncbi:MAG: radical SAM protein [Patescibacteria group bacterium]|nr:radical SAM protein [Patescibacteria group bacterium]